MCMLVCPVCMCVCMCVYVCLCVCVCLVSVSTYLQVNKMQAVELVEDVMGQGIQLAAVHVETLELLQTPEGTPLQPVQMRVVSKVQLLQIPQLTESTSLNPCDVVGEQPQNLDRGIDRDHV